MIHFFLYNPLLRLKVPAGLKPASKEVEDRWSGRLGLMELLGQLGLKAEDLCAQRDCSLPKDRVWKLVPDSEEKRSTIQLIPCL